MPARNATTGGAAATTPQRRRRNDPDEAALRQRVERGDKDFADVMAKSVDREQLFKLINDENEPRLGGFGKIGFLAGLGKPLTYRQRGLPGRVAQQGAKLFGRVVQPGQFGQRGWRQDRRG
jgi:hypothetical protein